MSNIPAALANNRLATSRVFIDTEAYKSAGLDWNASVWKSLKELATSTIVRLVTTDVTVREVERRLAEALTEAETAVRKNRSIFNQFSFRLDDADHDKRLATLKAHFRHFMEDCRFTRLPITTDPNVVLEKYFNQLPPFSSTKKYEFPDAFVLETLREWAEQSFFRVYVISKDRDVIAYCENEPRFIHLHELKELISLARADESIQNSLKIHIDNDQMLHIQIEKFIESFSDDAGLLSNLSVDDFSVFASYVIDDDEDGFLVSVDFMVELEFDYTNPISNFAAERLDHNPFDDNVDEGLSDFAFVSVNVTISAKVNDEGHVEYRTEKWELDPAEIRVDLPKAYGMPPVRLSPP